MTGTRDVLIDAVKDSSKAGPITPPYAPQEKYHRSKRTQWRQWLACISATLSMVEVGTVFGWTTTSLSRLTSGDSDVPFKLTDDEGSWIVSLTVIGCMIGPFLGVFLADRFGRKRCLLLSSGFYIAGWLIVLFAKNVSELYASRVILGIGVGVSYTANPTYVSEVADVNIRGALGTLIAMNVFTGSLLACSVGPWVSYHVLAMVLLAVPIVFISCFMWFPESPHFLAARGRRAEASRSLAFFKGIRDRDEARMELDLALRGVPADEAHVNPPTVPRPRNTEPVKHSWSAKLRMMVLPNNARALSIVLGLTMAQQFSGNFTTIQYLQVLFKKAAIGINTNVATILVLAVGLVSSGLATATVEGAGRRLLLIISTLGSFVTLLVLAIYLMLDYRGVDVSPANLLPVIDVIVFQVVYQIGLGTLPNALIGELFPTEVKGAAGAIVTVCDGVLGFAVSKLYQVISDSLGSHTVYYFFSASCLIALTMVTLFIPETKGKTFSEIQELLRSGRRHVRNGASTANRGTRNNDADFA